MTTPTYTLHTATVSNGRVYDGTEQVRTLHDARMAVRERIMRHGGAATVHAEVVDGDTVLAAYEPETGTWHQLQRWGA